jgi:uncharacterized membrane protein HdeD (DUF308 family)
MTNNVGTTDRLIRFVLGIVLIAVGLTHVVSGGMAIAAYAVGVIALITGVVRYCPAWTIFGINTCRLKSSETK